MSDDRSRASSDRPGGHDSASKKVTRPLDEDEPTSSEEGTSVAERERIEPNSTQAGELGDQLRDIEAGDPTVEMQLSEEMLARWREADKAGQNSPAKGAETPGDATRPISQERTAKRSVSDAIEIDDEGFIVFLARVTPRGDVRLPARLQQICADQESPLVLLKARVLGDEE